MGIFNRITGRKSSQPESVESKPKGFNGRMASIGKGLSRVGKFFKSIPRFIQRDILKRPIEVRVEGKNFISDRMEREIQKELHIKLDKITENRDKLIELKAKQEKNPNDDKIAIKIDGLERDLVKDFKELDKFLSAHQIGKNSLLFNLEAEDIDKLLEVCNTPIVEHLLVQKDNGISEAIESILNKVHEDSIEYPSNYTGKLKNLAELISLRIKYKKFEDSRVKAVKLPGEDKADVEETQESQESLQLEGFLEKLRTPLENEADESDEVKGNMLHMIAKNKFNNDDKSLHIFAGIIKNKKIENDELIALLTQKDDAGKTPLSYFNEGNFSILSLAVIKRLDLDNAYSILTEASPEKETKILMEKQLLEIEDTQDAISDIILTFNRLDKNETSQEKQRIQLNIKHAFDELTEKISQFNEFLKSELEDGRTVLDSLSLEQRKKARDILDFDMVRMLNEDGNNVATVYINDDSREAFNKVRLDSPIWKRDN